MTDGLTAPQKLLITAASMPMREFGINELVVAAWKAYPDTFGLSGFIDQYPDNNKVASAMAGKKGLVARGWFDQMATKRYSLSIAGRHEAAELSNGKGHRDLRKIKVPQNIEDYLGEMIDSKAFKFFRAKQFNSIRFVDALDFWVITDEDDDRDMEFSIELANESVSDSKKYMVQGSLAFSTGQVVPLALLDQLGECNQWLLAKFTAQLNKAKEIARGVAKAL